MYKYFKNRSEAGKQLAIVLNVYKDADFKVMALPRGGVPIGFEIATSLNIPLNVIISKKIGAPRNRELAVGAVSENNTVVLFDDLIKRMQITGIELKQLIAERKKDIRKNITLYRQGEKLTDMNLKNVIIADDGLATGMTALAAILALKKIGAKKIILAIPVSADDAINYLSKYAKVVSLLKITQMHSIGNWYENFEQVEDEDVLEYLSKSRK